MVGWSGKGGLRHRRLVVSRLPKGDLVWSKVWSMVWSNCGSQRLVVSLKAISPLTGAGPSFEHAREVWSNCDTQMWDAGPVDRIRIPEPRNKKPQKLKPTSQKPKAEVSRNSRACTLGAVEGLKVPGALSRSNVTQFEANGGGEQVEANLRGRGAEQVEANLRGGRPSRSLGAPVSGLPHLFDLDLIWIHRLTLLGLNSTLIWTLLGHGPSVYV